MPREPRREILIAAAPSDVRIALFRDCRRPGAARAGMLDLAANSCQAVHRAVGVQQFTIPECDRPPGTAGAELHAHAASKVAPEIDDIHPGSRLGDAGRRPGIADPYARYVAARLQCTGRPCDTRRQPPRGIVELRCLPAGRFLPRIVHFAEVKAVSKRGAIGNFPRRVARHSRGRAVSKKNI